MPLHVVGGEEWHITLLRNPFCKLDACPERWFKPWALGYGDGVYFLFSKFSK